MRKHRLASLVLLVLSSMLLSASVQAGCPWPIGTLGNDVYSFVAPNEPSHPYPSPLSVVQPVAYEFVIHNPGPFAGQYLEIQTQGIAHDPRALLPCDGERLDPDEFCTGMPIALGPGQTVHAVMSPVGGRDERFDVVWSGSNGLEVSVRELVENRFSCIYTTVFDTVERMNVIQLDRLSCQ